MTRLRCIKCRKRFTDTKMLVEHPYIETLRRQEAAGVLTEYGAKLMRERYHMAMRYQSGGRGRYGTRTYLSHCGPVEVEVVDEYVEQLEHFIGEDLG